MEFFFMILHKNVYFMTSLKLSISQDINFNHFIILIFIYIHTFVCICSNRQQNHPTAKTNKICWFGSSSVLLRFFFYISWTFLLNAFCARVFLRSYMSGRESERGRTMHVNEKREKVHDLGFICKIYIFVWNWFSARTKVHTNTHTHRQAPSLTLMGYHGEREEE